jgi:hypothetical protein
MDKIKPQIRRLTEHEVLLKNNTQWLYFSEPDQWITAETLDEVLPALADCRGPRVACQAYDLMEKSREVF